MGFVGVFVDREIRGALGVADAVEAVEAVNLGAGDFGHLRFVGIERGDGFVDRAVAADVPGSVYDVLRTGKRRRIHDVLFAHTQGFSKLSPELWVRARGALLSG